MPVSGHISEMEFLAGDCDSSGVALLLLMAQTNRRGGVIQKNILFTNHTGQMKRYRCR